MNKNESENKIEITVKPPVKIRTFNDINYIEMLEDFERHFCGNIARVETNYKPLQSFNVYFEPKQLPHLMGWDKITNKKIGSSRINELIKLDNFNVESTRKHHKFHESRKRMLNYNFLHEIFIYKKHNICVMTRDMKPNSMRLDIVFYKELEKEATILGLRKDNRMDYFVPTTLHNRGLNNQFSRRRRSTVKNIKWNTKPEKTKNNKT